MSRDRVLIVEDEETIRWSVAERLRAEDIEVEEAATGAAAVERLSSSPIDLVLLDLKLPDTDGIVILRQALALEPDLLVIILTAHGTIANAVEAMRLGAHDYKTKPFALEELVLSVGKGLATSRLRRAARLSRAQPATAGLGDLVSASEPMRAIAALVGKLGTSELSTVLILGESGTGKGAVAEAIHYANPARADRPFVAVTCTAIPENLLESELFGHEKGAFTDAKEMKRGLFEVADRGTLFLDEIGDMPLGLQGKLLRFLEERKFKRVGGTRDIHVDVRVIAATNRDLDRAVADGRFRTDLFYRLKVVPIVIPPLRLRLADIRPLAERFIARFAGEFKTPVRGLEPAALDALLAHPWPGNVRELKNVIERAVIFCEGERLARRDLLIDSVQHAPAASASDGPRGPFLLTRAGVDIRELEMSLVRQALEMAHGNYAEAGRLLGLTREQVKYRAEKLALKAPAKA